MKEQQQSLLGSPPRDGSPLYPQYQHHGAKPYFNNKRHSKPFQPRRGRPVDDYPPPTHFNDSPQYPPLNPRRSFHQSPYYHNQKQNQRFTRGSRTNHVDNRDNNRGFFRGKNTQYNNNNNKKFYNRRNNDNYSSRNDDHFNYMSVDQNMSAVNNTVDEIQKECDRLLHRIQEIDDRKALIDELLEIEQKINELTQNIVKSD